MLNESIVLLSRALGEWLKPVSAVGDSQLHGPTFHAFGHCIGSGEIECNAVVYYLAHLLVNLGRQVVCHLLPSKDVLCKVFAGALRACCHFNGALLERLAYHMES